MRSISSGSAARRPTQRRAGNFLVKPGAFERSHGLRITDAGNVARRVEHDCRRHYGTGETAMTDLVNAGDVDESHAADRVFQCSKGSDLHGSDRYFRLNDTRVGK